MMPIIPLENTIATLRQLHPFHQTLSLHLFVIISLNTPLSWIGFCLHKLLPFLPICLQVSYLGWFMNISQDASY